ncbi:MAG: hypothetical protein WKF94_19450 [Solirubrobacteraceae bacterium]
MRASSSERGEVSLTALLTAMAIMVVVLGSTLGMLDSVTRVAADGTRRTDAQDAARSSVDRISAALRNLASPTPQQPQAVDQASAASLVFKTVDADGPNSGDNATNTKRVRYCLDDAAQLQEQTQTWTTAAVPAMPSTSGCPASDWTRTQILAQHVVNGEVPIFSFDSAVLTDISAIHLELLVDTDVVRAPGSTRLASGVFLRNQNRRPTAAFTATRTSGRIVLNGSASSDPEGQALDYAWFDGTTAIGSGITLSYPVAAGSPHSLSLQVTDPAGLSAVSATQAVVG